MTFCLGRATMCPMATKQEIAAQFREWQAAKEKIGTAEEFAARYGISRARLYQILDEVPVPPHSGPEGSKTDAEGPKTGVSGGA